MIKEHQHLQSRPSAGSEERRLALVEYRADDADAFAASLSSEEPYRRWWGTEVLDHASGAVDLTRAADGLPLLFGHDAYSPGSLIGRAENVRIENRRLKADLRFFSTDDAQRVATMVREGHREMSIGYQVNDMVLASKSETEETYRVTSWTPFEASIVSVPADPSVGVGRGMSGSRPGRFARKPNEENMDLDDQGTPAVANEQRSAAGRPDQQSVQDPQPPMISVSQEVTRALQIERDRVAQIRAAGERFGMQDLANTAVRDGTSLEVWRERVLGKLQDSGALRPAESPEIGMSARDVGQFSFCRALLAAQDPIHAAQIAPFELECARAAQARRGNSRPEREAAITIPVDVLNSGLALSTAAAQSAARMLIERARRSAQTRDLNVTTATAGGNLVATELLGSDFISLLRNAMVLDRLGVRFLRDLNGNVAIPRQSGAGTGYWVAENTAITSETAQTIDQVTLTPKTVGAYTDYSRRLLMQSSIDVEAFVRADLAAILGLMIQLAAINGSGSSNQPTGILNTSGIGAVAGGTNGAAPTYDLMVDLESAVANANADAGTLAFLTNTKVRGKLRKTQEFASTNGKAVWTSGAQRGVGDVLGYDSIVTNSVPSDLTKGSASGVCSAIAFGDWSQLMIGMWGGLDLMLDPYTGATAGTRRVVGLQDVDVACRQPSAFAAMKDALTT